MFRFFRRDAWTVVADLDDHGFIRIAKCVQFNSSVRLFATDGLHGVLQQVQYNLRDQIFIRLNDLIGRFNMYINSYIGEIVVMAGQIYHSFREFLHIE